MSEEQVKTRQLLELCRQIRTTNDNGQLNAEKKWIIQQLDDDTLVAMIPKISIVGLHILSALTCNDKTGIELANELSVTRGGITRAARILVELSLVEKVPQTTDKKKIYYHLTPLGKKLALVHTQMHLELEKKFFDLVATNYSSADLDLIINFLQDLTQAEHEFHTF
ncbi:transcriptional regulator [Ligilactobacillus animalis]|nr:transcriptional regulator [Ligilactobacillus animalis]